MTDTSDSTSSSSSSSLPYHEPSIERILVLSSFLILLNAVNSLLDRAIYCGLIGQILLGVVFGFSAAPSKSRWLDVSTQEVIVALGYLGLILLVYEGGLSTVYKSLRANLALSVGVAATGISLPIGLSYVLVATSNATPLQAFAAGAALCSTSLGTTFTVLGASGLADTRMGVVLSSAAMLDDVVGLVMVQVISNLGPASSGGSSEFNATTVVRPIFVSLGFAVVVPIVARLVVQPLTVWVNGIRTRTKGSTRLQRVVGSKQFVLVVHTLLLIGMVTAAAYAGTSTLFAAYLAGAAVSWWDAEVPHYELQNDGDDGAQANNSTSGKAIFDDYYEPPLRRILKPFFFASIGFSIPITQLFDGTIVWKGIVYTILMTIGKVFCGAWLIRIPGLAFLKTSSVKSNSDDQTRDQVAMQKLSRSKKEVVKSDRDSAKLYNREQSQMLQDDVNSISAVAERREGDEAVFDTKEAQTLKRNASHKSNESRKMVPQSTTSNQSTHNGPSKDHTSPATKPISIYPACIVGAAMTARGEIGFLISSLAQSNGIFSSTNIEVTNNEDSSPIFLIVTWAIMLCTIVGPITVGVLVKRVRRLEAEACKVGSGREKDVLGVWGVE